MIQEKEKLLNQKIKQSIDEFTNSPLRSLFSVLLDIPFYNNIIAQNNIDNAKINFMQINKTQILRAFLTLTKIQDLLLSQKKNEEAYERFSNEFYSIIPQNYLNRRPPRINNYLRLKEKVKLVELL